MSDANSSTPKSSPAPTPAAASGGQPKTTFWTARNIRIIIIIALVAYIVGVASANWTETPIQLLFMSVHMRLTVLILATLVGGFVIGYLAHMRRGKK